MKPNYRYPLLALFILISTIFVSISTTARAQSNNPTVQVVTTSCPPFVMEEAGKFSGLSIYLLDRNSDTYLIYAANLSSARGLLRPGVECLHRGL